ncbi:cation-translocating P-type ATPase [Bacillus marinisedimentorum]|uniref:cation-translocating P-type ATPase n=1 Tax=Bacillus marinisedimentorum TaxID=1821260 RepID=UPI0008727E4C|nr:cation-translocating P-type ATPase [Bacillus marinisedimentorum]
MWSQKSARETAKLLNTSIEDGLTDGEITVLREKYGENVFEEQEKQTVLQMVWEQINSVLIYILMAAAVISAVVGEISDAVIIALVIILNAAIGVFQESKAEKSLDALKKMSSPKAVVKRNGQVQEVASEELVPGDLVLLDAGRYVPADLRLTEAINLKVEESALTGESVPVEKRADWTAPGNVPAADQVNMAFMSTLTTYGRGSGIVVRTGMDTEIGKIAGMLGKQVKEQTPLQMKLAELGKFLGFGAVVISLIIFFLGFWQGRNPFDMFLIAVSLAVAAIPEGLPAIVTIVLALGVQRMIKRNAVVRKLPSVETLGSVSVICSDKTGTLTLNKMTVTDFFTNNKQGKMEDLDPGGNTERLFLEAMVLCNDADISNGRETGDPTETALLTAGAGNGLDKKALDEKYPRIFEVPFDSERKRMATVHEYRNGTAVFVKGAVESVLPKLTGIMAGGTIKPIGQNEEQAILKQVDQMSADALRVLMFAYKNTDRERLSPDALESDLVFLGLTGMIDPPREEVKDAVQTCRDAGIRTIMITGDHKMTAVAIAKSLGIADSEKEAMTGAELDSISDEELKERVTGTTIFARVSPDHKVRIVQALKGNGMIAAMTGDGVNDAPSLKQADVGVAMGITGTDVAKGAADIVLMDDNFATITAAVEEGRNIYRNIRKSVLFLLSCNIGEIIALFIAILLGWPAPLAAIHILWVNLITDTLPAISLGVDPDDSDVMKEPPRQSGEGIFSGTAGLFTAANGLVIGLLTLTAFVTGLKVYSGAESFIGMDFSMMNDGVMAKAQTMAFLTLSISQLVHSLNLRHPSKSIFEIGLTTNPYLLGSIVLGILLQAGLVYTPFLAEWFKLSPIGMNDWLFIGGLALVPLIVNEIAKRFSTREW